MPRAQRTKSAVHEALQRRAGQRPGASFSVKLDAPPPAWRPPLRFHTGCFALATSQDTGEHGDTCDSRRMCRTHFTTLFRRPGCSAATFRLLVLGCDAREGPTSRHRRRLSPAKFLQTRLQARYVALLRQQSVLPRRHRTWRPLVIFNCPARGE
jgi:hypothetical protein